MQAQAQPPSRPLMLRNNRGETLIEVLAAILIATLSVALLFTCVMASSRIEDSVQKKDAEHYGALSDAEGYATPSPEPSATPAPVPTGNVTISWIKPTDSNPTPTPEAAAAPPVEFYGGEGTFSYKRAES